MLLDSGPGSGSGADPRQNDEKGQYLKIRLSGGSPALSGIQEGSMVFKQAGRTDDVYTIMSALMTPLIFLFLFFLLFFFYCS